VLTAQSTMRVIVALVLLLGVAYAATPIHYVTPTYDNSQPAPGAVADCGCSACPCASAPLGTNVVIDDEPTRYPAYNAAAKPSLMKSFSCKKAKSLKKPKCNKDKKKKKTQKAAKKAAKVAKDINKLKNKVAEVKATKGAPGNKKKIQKALATIQKDKAKVASGTAQINSKASKGPQAKQVKQQLKKEKKQLKKVEKKLKKELKKAGGSPAKKGAAPAASGARAELTQTVIKIAKLVRSVEQGLLKDAKAVDDKKTGVTDRLVKNKAAVAEARRQLADFRKKVADFLAAGKITADQARDENKAADMIQKKLDKAIPAALAIVKEDNEKKKKSIAGGARAGGPKLW